MEWEVLLFILVTPYYSSQGWIVNHLVSVKCNAHRNWGARCCDVLGALKLRNVSIPEQ